ncbi:signal peptidase I [Anaerococcus sp. mt242]|uniref:signal peptidase I n=1 Tax=Anaerococcus sp. mt242 TaxID=2661917 RepID=UPI001934554F|nr:signal peptidase I [Anaerococcus sp. mt242]MBM0046436.1 signal peptidase I [Anaerococcus sp. mt242]
MTNEKEKIVVEPEASKGPTIKANQKPVKEDEDGIIEWIKSIVIALAIAGLIKWLFLDATRVDGKSMLNTLHHDDMLFVNKIGKHFHDYERGDIVILKAPDAYNKLYVKRVVGVPGDTVTLKDEKVYLNGEELNEPYTSVDYTLQTSDTYEWYLLDNQYFVMGDNRAEGASNDSRNYGPVEKDEIVGHAFFRFYPFSDMGNIDNNPYGESN